MAVLSVPRPLQERLGEAATESLVEMLRQIESDQEERREVQKEQLLQVLEERFLRHVAESEKRTNAEIAAVRVDLGKEIAAARGELGKEIAAVRVDLGKEIAAARGELGKEITDVRKEITDVHKEIADVHKEIADVHKEIADIRKEITIQTRWILAVLGGAAVLIPILQRVMAALIP
jgi:gas vesicle protein